MLADVIVFVVGLYATPIFTISDYLDLAHDVYINCEITKYVKCETEESNGLNSLRQKYPSRNSNAEYNPLPFTQSIKYTVENGFN